jgi:hypothetical protein
MLFKVVEIVVVLEEEQESEKEVIKNFKKEKENG